MGRGSSEVVLDLILVGSYSVFVSEMLMSSFEDLQRHWVLLAVSFYLYFIIPILQIRKPRPRETSNFCGVIKNESRGSSLVV